MIIEKSALQRTLRTLRDFDPQACPYVATQLTQDSIKFHRVGNYGFIQSADYSPADPAIYISLSHLSEILRVIPDEKLEVSKDARGLLRLNSLNSSFHSNFFVHTVSKDSAGMKAHILGNIHQVDLDPTSFNGLDITPFQQQKAGEPVLVNGRLMIPIQTGVMFWDGNEVLKPLQVSPRAMFLRVIGGESLGELFISERGYWSAVLNSGLTAYVYGHTGNKGLFSEYSAAGTELAVLPANQIMYALKAASNLCGSTNRVEVDPKVGVLFKDQFGEPSSIGIGTYTSFSRFGLYTQMAKTIADAFAQTNEDEVVLSSVPSSGTPVMRFRRGKFEVNVRVLK